jgi:hypothetical protein
VLIDVSEPVMHEAPQDGPWQFQNGHAGARPAVWRS